MSDRLAAAVARPLTLVVAPAGFGKTTLLSGWASEQQPRTAWLSLDVADNDPQRFWSGFFNALAIADVSGAAWAASAMTRATLPPLTEVLTLLTGASATAGAVVVLDDYHLVYEPAIHRRLSELLERPPAGLRLIIASRAEPPLPLPRLRARGQLSELTAADLRLSAAEAEQMLRETLGMQLGPDASDRLRRHADGWPAVLQLMALASQYEELEQVSAEPAAHPVVVDYLITEVVQAQAPALQHFLLTTSVLARLTGDLCDALTGEENGWSVLNALERTNIFLLPADPSRQAYRYHPLFAEALRAHLRATRPALLAELYRRASGWHRRRGEHAEAMEYALLGGDWEQAIDLLDLLAPSLISQGEFRTVQHWLDALPVARHASDPDICFYGAWVSLQTGGLRASEALLDSAEAGWRATRRSERLGRAYALRAVAASVRQDAAGAVRWASEALALLPQTDHLLRALSTSSLGWGYHRMGELSRAARAATEARVLHTAIGSRSSALHATVLLAEIAVGQGRLRQAAAWYREVIEQGEAIGDWTTIPAYIGLGGVYLEWNDLASAQAHVGQGVALCQQSGAPTYYTNSYIPRSRLHWAQGEPDVALRLLDEAVLQARRLGVEALTERLEAQRARLWLLGGEVALAAEWAARRLDTRDLPPDARRFVDLTQIQVMIAQGEHREAMQTLDTTLGQARAAGRSAEVLELTVLQALCYAGQGLSRRALSACERAVRLGKSDGYRRVFIDQPPALRGLLISLLLQTPDDVYLRDVVRLTEPGWPASPGGAPAQVALLSGRELAVLQLIADGTSNKEIAHQLCITLHTVKKHLSNLYTKLEVGSRTQAIAQARLRGLL